MILKYYYVFNKHSTMYISISGEYQWGIYAGGLSSVRRGIQLYTHTKTHTHTLTIAKLWLILTVFKQFLNSII